MNSTDGRAQTDETEFTFYQYGSRHGIATLRPQGFDQPAQESTDIGTESFSLACVYRRLEPYGLYKNELRFDLAIRTTRLTEELQVFASGTSPESLRDIAGYRNRGPAKLRRESESFGGWKSARQRVNGHREVDRSLPSDEVTK
jgi:hypothetical protein